MWFFDSHSVVSEYMGKDDILFAWRTLLVRCTHICWENGAASGTLFYFVKITSIFTIFLLATSSAPQILKTHQFVNKNQQIGLLYYKLKSALLKLNGRTLIQKSDYKYFDNFVKNMLIFLNLDAMLIIDFWFSTIRF